jgi:CMD domain protein
MSAETTDIIDFLAGIEPGSILDGIRARRLQARENAQKSYIALFEPVDFRDFAAADRYAVAAFVAGVHGEPAAAGFYLAKVGRSELVEALKAEIERAKTKGPYGAFPAGPLSVEDKVGPIYRVGDEHRRALGAKLSAAFEHAHLLVFRPRDATAEALQSLLEGGWSNTAIVTFSQLVAFAAFQVRAVAGLRTLGASLGNHE